MSSVKISVIVPFFGVERFIGRCVESLMNQTLTEGVEFLFIDDGSEDGSRHILEQLLGAYPSRNARIITHNRNYGLPTARNTGLSVARGLYILHCDSDDYLEPDMLESLYDEALRSEAEIVYCDYFKSFSNRETVSLQPLCTTPQEILRSLLHGNMQYNVWNKLVKRDLYHRSGVRFPEGHTFGEDTSMILLFASATSVSGICRPLYHYVQYNESALTKQISSRDMVALRFNTQRVIDYLSAKGVSRRDLDAFAYLMKWPLLTTGKYDEFKRWRELFPALRLSSVLKSRISLRIKLIEVFAQWGQWWAVWLHYRLIIRLYYSIALK